MRLSSVVSLLATLVVAVEAKPLRRATKHVVHEEKPVARRSRFKTSRLHRSKVLPVRIGLAQRNLERAEEFIYDVAHPDSVSYGKHWSPEDIVDMFSPAPETIDLVMEWLESEGISPSRTKRVEQQDLEYHVYKHDAHGHHHYTSTSARDTTEPTKILPVSPTQDAELRKLILQRRQIPEHGILGSPASGFGPKQGATVTNALVSLAECAQMITPACLRALYATPPGNLAASNNTLGIVEYTPQAFLQTDLDVFFEQFQPELVGQSPIVQLVDNGVLQTDNQSFAFNGESALDLEFAMALIHPQRATLYQVGDLVKGASFNNFLDSIDASYCTFEGGNSADPNVDSQYPSSVGCGGFAATKVISTSYGYNEADLGARYERRQCDEYRKLGLMGVTVVYSSGDYGVAGNGGQCIDPLTGAYNNGSSAEGGIFNPSFPGTCPYVTSVGATQILNGSSVRSPESTCQDVIFSGGGFSNVFALPEYQRRAMETYYAEFAPPYGAERFNDSRLVRGFPDVSVNGANYLTAVNDKFSLSFGTSASAPVFATLVSLINERRLAAGKGSVGFINPVLYENAQVLNDVTTGNNPGCGTDGFAAVEGWDPLTGLGTPNFPAMQDLFLSLP
ncbi:Pro-kumamolisin [Coniochaeta sp. 2T2.1]|nr:Pro-kumamolisin [Coniochaeta sp. 2T2.1]